MALSLDELWEKAADAIDRDRTDESISLLKKILSLGDDDAAPLLAQVIFGKAIDLYNATINLQDERRVKGAMSASAMLGNVAGIALYYLVNHPEPGEDANSAAQIIVHAYAQQYVIASSGTTFGYRVIEDGYDLRRVTIERLGDLTSVTREWEKYHDDYFSSLPTGLSVFGNLDDQDIHIRESIQEVLVNARDTAAVLTLIGRECDAYMLRTRMALACAGGTGGNRKYLLSAECLIKKSRELARRMYRDSGDAEGFKQWLEAHDQTIQLYSQMSLKFANVIKTYKSKGIKPKVTRFFREDETVPEFVLSSSNAKTTRSRKSGKVSGGAKFDTFLSMVAKISFKEYIPAFVMTSIAGLFLGGVFGYSDLGTAGRAIAITCTVLSLIVMLVRSVKDSVDRGYGPDGRKYVLFMLLFTVLLSLQWLIGLVVFIILKVLSGKFSD